MIERQLIQRGHAFDQFDDVAPILVPAQGAWHINTCCAGRGRSGHHRKSSGFAFPRRFSPNAWFAAHTRLSAPSTRVRTVQVPTRIRASRQRTSVSFGRSSTSPSTCRTRSGAHLSSFARSATANPIFSATFIASVSSIGTSPG